MPRPIQQWPALLSTQSIVKSNVSPKETYELLSGPFTAKQLQLRLLEDENTQLRHRILLSPAIFLSNFTVLTPGEGSPSRSDVLQAPLGSYLNIDAQAINGFNTY